MPRLPLRLAVIGFVVALTASGSGCAPEALTVTRQPATVRLAAADSVGPLARQLAEAFEAAFPWVAIEVTVLNTAQAEIVLRDDEADLAMLAHPEKRLGEAPLWSTPWRRDGIAVILHPTTRLPGTSLGYLQEIFRGRLQEWEGIVFAVVSRENGSGTRNAFESIVMDYHAVTLNARVVASSRAVIETVGATPGAIGYVSELRLNAGDLASVQVLEVDGIDMDATSVANGSYLLWRQLTIAAASEPTGEAREFVQWVLGPEGQAIAAVYARGSRSGE